MKRQIAALLFLACMLVPFSCAAQADEPLSIVCTTFAQYDWVRQVLGGAAEEAQLSLLLDSRVDMHSYQPSASDIVAIAECDLFIYGGGESDEWAADILAMTQNPQRIAIAMTDCVKTKAEQTVSGVQEHAHDHDHNHDHNHDAAADEHVWLSVRNAQTITGRIADALCALRPQNAAAYRENADGYIAQLSALDARYQEMADTAKRKTILFADRFPFRYLADDYGLSYCAAFSGCSAESEASFETIVFLAQKADELDLPFIMVIEGTEHEIAQTVISNTTDRDQEILTMNSMQSVTQKDIRDGVTYLGVMEDNLEVLTQALN